MEACANCGWARRQGTAFCTGCGRRFADDPQPTRVDTPSAASGRPAESPGPAEPYQPAAPAPDPYRRDESWPPAESNTPAAGGYPSGSPGPPYSGAPYSGPPYSSRRSETGVSRRTFRPLVIAAVVVLVAAAVAAGATLLYGRHHGHTQAQDSHPPASATASAPGGAPAGADGSTAPQSPSDTSSSAPSGSTVTVGPAASQNPAASAVAPFLDQYFAAINAHDYPSYLSLLSSKAQQGMTQAQFEKGYRSTADSDETLVGISTASTGDLAAEVTFTSHQDPADSPDHSESCTNWDITLFLAQGGSGYVIDPAPPGYQASYQPC